MMGGPDEDDCESFGLPMPSRKRKSEFEPDESLLSKKPSLSEVLVDEGSRLSVDSDSKFYESGDLAEKDEMGNAGKQKNVEVIDVAGSPESDVKDGGSEGMEKEGLEEAKIEGKQQEKMENEDSRSVNGSPSSPSISAVGKDSVNEREEENETERSGVQEKSEEIKNASTPPKVEDEEVVSISAGNSEKVEVKEETKVLNLENDSEEVNLKDEGVDEMQDDSESVNQEDDSEKVTLKDNSEQASQKAGSEEFAGSSLSMEQNGDESREQEDLLPPATKKRKLRENDAVSILLQGDKGKKSLSAEDLIEFISVLAQNPCTRIPDSSSMKAEVLNIRDALYAGPPITLRKKAAATSPANQGGGVPTGPAAGPSPSIPSSWKRKLDRPCSPSHFPPDQSKSLDNKISRKKADPQSSLSDFQQLISSRFYYTHPPDMSDNSRKIRESRNLLGINQPGKTQKKIQNTNQAKAEVAFLGLQHYSTLGALASPLYRQSIEEQWSAREVSLFESAICAYGKQFHSIQRQVKSKTTKQVIDFYYVWKKTNNYKIWKRTFEYRLPQ